MAKYRNEWKYLCSDGQAMLLKSRLQGLLDYDAHAKNGQYSIHSLYFDDWRDRSAYGNALGESARFKYRIRYYGDHPTELFLERKEKYMNFCRKDSCPICLEQCEKLMRGKADEFVYEDEPLLKRFCYGMMTRGFAPKLIVSYIRIAFVESITNIRVTIDQNISASYDTEGFLSGDYLQIPLQPKHQHLLEVKFDDILPGYIKNLVTSEDFQQTSFSKYYLGRKTMEEFIR